MRGRKDDDRVVLRSLVMVTQFGVNMIVPISMMTAMGIWLDGKFGTSFITSVFFAAGAVAGAQNIYRMAKQICADGAEGADSAGAGDGAGAPIEANNKKADKNKKEDKVHEDNRDIEKDE